jgi:hypothetical protein
MDGAAHGQSGRAAYAWRLAGRWHSLEVRTRGRAALPEPCSEAAFIAEHYWGYTVQRDGGSKGIGWSTQRGGSGIRRERSSM